MFWLLVAIVRRQTNIINEILYMRVRLYWTQIFPTKSLKGFAMVLDINTKKLNNFETR
jgi:hypothetical protein